MSRARPHVTGFRLTIEEHRALEVDARKIGCSVSELIRRLLSQAASRDEERAAVASYLRAHADHAPSGLWDAYALNLMAARIATGEGVDGAALVECLRKGGAQ